jgi:uncharacterized repeat protein (TIGR01451 family)
VRHSVRKTATFPTGSLRQLVVSLLGVVTIAGLTVVAPQPAAASHQIDLTAKITYVKVLSDGLEGLGRGDGDLYAGFAIGSSTFTDCGTFASHGHGQTEIRPTDWVCSQKVTITDHDLPGSANVDLQVWDHDDCDDAFCTDTGVLESNDDQADASPGGNYTLSLSVDLTNGRWTSAGGTTDTDWPANCAQGSGDNAVQICFDISIDSASGDADSDGLLDGWERNGYNADGDNTIDVDLPALGVNVQRKDLLLELDCLVATGSHTHCPPQNAVRDVVLGFANAPVDNPDGSLGVQLHVDMGNIYGQAFNAATNVARTEAPAGPVTGTIGNYGSTTSISETGNTIVDFDGAAGNPGVDIATIRAANMNPNRSLIMRYGLFGHQTNARRAVNDCTSGLANGDSFMVTLGGLRNPVPPATTPTVACWSTDAGGQSVGNRTEQAGTLMHEFGHVLSLGHGGGDGDNNKPNYFSVMNYSFQQCGVPATPGISLPGGCDFSRIKLDQLDETALDECVGLGNGLGPNNWNGDGNFSGPFLEGATCAPPATTDVSKNINGDTTADADGNGVQNGSEPDRLSTLKGYDDWANLQYLLKANGGGAGGDGTIDATPELIAHAEALIAELLRPAPDVAKTGPSDAIPGDTLTYTLDASNTAKGDVFARGRAVGVTLVDTYPDTTTANFNIGTLEVSGAASRTTTYIVPCTTGDGTTLSNQVSLSASDLLGNPFTASDTVQTTIHAPVMTIAKTATATVNAGEPITYQLTYQNTGSGDAKNVQITDLLPQGVYYSTALDQGAGPKPTTVQRNANGTTTLIWTIGSVNSATGSQVISYQARPTLLFLGGESLTNTANLSFKNANDCTFTAASASAQATVTVAPITRDPMSMGFWRNHPELWSAELRARIQATDLRFDGADGTTADGQLSTSEVVAVMAPSGNGARVLQQQLLATLLNLSSRRINAATAISSKLAGQLGLANVRDAVVYTVGTLGTPLTKATQTRYSNATNILDSINQNKIEVY